MILSDFKLLPILFTGCSNLPIQKKILLSDQGDIVSHLKVSNVTCIFYCLEISL